MGYQNYQHTILDVANKLKKNDNTHLSVFKKLKKNANLWVKYFIMKFMNAIKIKSSRASGPFFHPLTPLFTLKHRYSKNKDFFF
jgi:hypothetical protein